MPIDAWFEMKRFRQSSNLTLTEVEEEMQRQAKRPGWWGGGEQPWPVRLCLWLAPPTPPLNPPFPTPNPASAVGVTHYINKEARTRIKDTREENHVGVERGEGTGLHIEDKRFPLRITISALFLAQITSIKVSEGADGDSDGDDEFDTEFHKELFGGCADRG